MGVIIQRREEEGKCMLVIRLLDHNCLLEFFSARCCTNTHTSTATATATATALSATATTGLDTEEGFNVASTGRRTEEKKVAAVAI